VQQTPRLAKPHKSTKGEGVTTRLTDPDVKTSPRTRLRHSELRMLAAVSMFLGVVLVLVSLAEHGL
jgi:hypothetical protein